MRIYLFLALFLFSNLLLAQKRLIPLSEAIKTIEKKKGVTFSYDADLTKNILLPKNSTSTIELINQYVEKELPFEIRKIDNENYLLIPNPPSQTTLYFSVSDDDESIPGVLVSLPQHKLKTSSDDDGKVEISGNLSPFDTIILDGYTFEKKIMLVYQIEQNSNIKLTHQIEILPEIIIENYMVSGISANMNDHSLSIDQKDLSIIPGQTSGDVLQSIAIIPGINSPNSKAGNLFIRGSTRDQTLIYFDDIPLYNKGHFFGTISPFNQLAVDKVNVYRNGSHPRLGGRVGGIIEVNTSDQITDSLENAIGLSMTEVLAYSRVPIVKGKVDLLISGRHSLPSELNTPRQRAIIDFLNQDSPFEQRVSEPGSDTKILERTHSFRDLNGKVSFDSDSTNITLSFLHTQSFRLRDYEDFNPSERSTDYLGGDNNGLNSQWKQKWNNRISTNLSFTLSHYDNLSENKEATEPTYEYNSSKLFKASIFDINAKLESRWFAKNDKNYLDFGYNFDRHRIRNSGFEELPRGGTSMNSRNQLGMIHSGFAHYNFHEINKLSVNLGARISHFSTLNKLYYEPRMFVNYELTKNFTLKSSYSQNHQFIQQVIVLDFNDIKPDNFNWGLSNDLQTPSKSQQVVIGGIYAPKQWIIDLELYNKLTQNIHLSAGFDPRIGDIRVYSGQALSRGIDLLVKRKIDKTNIWINYTFSKVKWIYEGFIDSYFDAYYDQPHLFNIGANHKINSITASANFRLASGMPNQTVIGLRPPPPGQPIIAPNLIENGRYPWHHQLDISLAYKYTPRRGKWNVQLSTSLNNIYNRKTQIDDQEDINTTFQIYTIGFNPNLQAVVNF